MPASSHWKLSTVAFSRTVLATATLLLTGVVMSVVPMASAAPVTFAQQADQYFSDVYFPFSPDSGTLAGLHQYDTRLDDYSRKGIEANIAALHKAEKEFSSIQASTLGLDEQIDLQLILNDIHSRLLSLETIRAWEKNPDLYSSGITASAFSIMERNFAPADQRLRSLIAREKLMPAVFRYARENLKNPPHIYTEIALEQLPGNISFFQNDVPRAFTEVTDPALQAEFARANGEVIAALKAYGQWMKDDLLPRSRGDYRIGEESFRKKLLYDEMVDLPLDKLIALDTQNMRANQAEFARLAQEVDPAKTPQQVLELLGQNHPSPDKLLDSFRATFDSLINFIHEKKIVTIPSTVRPVLEETPPFMRATTFASMDTPGPFETVAKEAYFNVTLPDPDMTPAQVESFMHSFNVGTVVSTSVHEAYPGHYIQFLWVPQAPSKTRTLLGAASNAEGWAHYCEQMMLEEGYGQPGYGAKDQREARLIKLGQLQDALLRNARFIVGIQMHTGHMSFDEAVAFFEKEGYQSHEAALVETKRGTSDPTYLYYTLGKLQILKLRDDYKAKMGASYTLQGFHDEFLKQGFPPIALVRRIMLGNSSATL